MALSVGYFSGIVLLACTIAVVHRSYLSYLFEQEYYFSHLSEREREISFKSEAGFYYSFYKTLVNHRLLKGMDMLITDNSTEYPDSINTLQRFNLYPEIFSALCYKTLKFIMSALDFPTRICFTVHRGPGREAVISCEGVGEPVFVYLECVFTLNGIMLGIFFLNGVYLSGNIFGGIITVLSFFYNHGECTRVYSTPPLRESFGYPFWVLQSFLVIYSLRADALGFAPLGLAIATFTFLLSWQLSQFILALQTSIVFILYIMKYLHYKRLKSIIAGQLAGLIIAAILQFCNSMLLTSYFLCVCLVSLLLAKIIENYCSQQRLPKRFFFAPVCFIMVFSMKSLMSYIFSIKDDTHIMDIMWSKFSSFKSFHAMLYTCAPEFSFIDIQTFIEISKTLLLPLTMCVLIGYLYCLLTKIGTDDHATFLYLIMHFFAFLVMAITVMRLKLFLIPHMCLMASSITSLKPSGAFLNKMSIFVAIVALMSYRGIQNVKLQSSISGEFNDDPTEQMINWISMKTSKDSVFAGSMSTMATIKLTTGRSIANHPHYENQALRERTKKIYTMFSRKSPREVWQRVNELNVDFIVLERAWCFGRSMLNCSLAAIWDVEDPGNLEKPKVCDVLRKNPLPHFESVFKNSQYGILKIVKDVDFRS